MSPSEVAILIVLIIAIIGIGGFFAKTVLDNNSRKADGQSSGLIPTYTLSPSETPSPEPTQLITTTPIPGWSKFEFANPPGELWLPESYEGGDTVNYPDIVLLSAEIFIDDQEFIDDIKNLIEIPEVVFFAFDTDSEGVIRFAYVMSEELDPDLDVTLDVYMNVLSDNAAEDGAKVVGRTTVQTDQYEAGRIVIENKVPAGDLEAFIHLTIYSIRLDNTMWNVAFRTGRDEYNDYLPVMDDVVNTFRVHP
jgi:hypothetical protein